MIMIIKFNMVWKPKSVPESVPDTEEISDVCRNMGITLLILFIGKNSIVFHYTNTAKMLKSTDATGNAPRNTYKYICT